MSNKSSSSGVRRRGWAGWSGQKANHQQPVSLTTKETHNNRGRASDRQFVRMIDHRIASSLKLNGFCFCSARETHLIRLQQRGLNDFLIAAFGFCHQSSSPTAADPTCISLVWTGSAVAGWKGGWESLSAAKFNLLQTSQASTRRLTFDWARKSIRHISFADCC